MKQEILADNTNTTLQPASPAGKQSKLGPNEKNKLIYEEMSFLSQEIQLKNSK
jgi:hypothetical protein